MAEWTPRVDYFCSQVIIVFFSQMKEFCLPQNGWPFVNVPLSLALFFSIQIEYDRYLGFRKKATKVY